MSDIQKRIYDWHIAEFGDGEDFHILVRTALKCAEESVEAQVEFHGRVMGKAAEELADVIIAGTALVERAKWILGPGWDSEVEKKFEIVKNRDQKKRDQERCL